MLDKLQEFFSNNGDILTAILTGVFTLLLFMAKEFLVAWRAKRRERKAQLDVFGVYGYPLLDAAKDLVDRLFDILLEKPRYLQKDSPDTEYYKYHYISTLYRMCSVLGWIRAIRREVANLEVGKTEANESLEQAITDFQSSLDSNDFMEGEQIAYLIDRWGLDYGEDEEGEKVKLEHDEKNKLEKEFEELVSSFMEDKEINNPMELEREEKEELLRKVRDKIAAKLNHTLPFEEELLTKYLNSCLRVITRRVSWIYLDWQKGIGDFMLNEAKTESATRRLELKSFQKFEDEYQEWKDGQVDHRWIARVDRLFNDLKPGSSILYDVRDQQLEAVSGKLVSLIEALRNAGVGAEKIKNEGLTELWKKKTALEKKKEEEREKREEANKAKNNDSP